MSEECIETRNGYFNVVNVESCTMKNVCIYVKHLEQENKQLKTDLEEANDNATWWNNRFNAVSKENKLYKSVLDEIREYIENNNLINILNRSDLLQILDKVNIDTNDVSKMFKNCTTLEPFLEHMDKVKDGTSNE